MQLYRLANREQRVKYPLEIGLLALEQLRFKQLDEFERDLTRTMTYYDS